MYPDFLVIGAQKSGTTWLYKILQTHPEICLPPEKEIHFFDFPPLIPFYFLLFSPNNSIRQWGKNRMIRDYHKVKIGELSFSWYVRYYLMPRTKQWYGSLFTKNSGQIAGDITPRYSTLNDTGVAKVHSQLPNAKIIYLLRSPIERMWSDLAMYHRPQFGQNELNIADDIGIKIFLQNSKHLANSQYFDNLTRWEQYYSSSQIFVGFQEQIRDEPEKLLNSICQFLGINNPNHLDSADVNKRINSHKYPPIPEHYAKMLAKLLIDDIDKLHQRFNNCYTEKWLISAHILLNTE